MHSTPNLGSGTRMGALSGITDLERSYRPPSHVSARSQVLLRPIELGLWDADGLTIGLSLGSTFGRTTGISEHPVCEDDKGLLVGAEVAVPTCRAVDASAQSFRELSHDLVIDFELDEGPCQRLSSADVADIFPADLANMQFDALQRFVFRDALCD